MSVSSDWPLLCTVSTVKDTLDNVRHFVESNLASGADHMFVFLDEEDPEVEDYLTGREHVTAIRTDETYWAGVRPEELRRRQLVNANLVTTLLAPHESAAWLAHIDGDECLEIDKDELPRLPPDLRCMRLSVREAASTEFGDRHGKLFKKKLGPGNLEELVRLGVLTGPSNRLWLTGHLRGKTLIRPALDLEIRLHRVVRRQGLELPDHRHPSFRVLHYECVSFDEFVRKWTSHVRAGGAAFREERHVLFNAVNRVVSDETLDDRQRRDAMLALYRKHVEDPVDLLTERGFLKPWQEEWHTYHPLGLRPQDREGVDALLALLLAADKSTFEKGSGPSATIEVLLGASEQLGAEHRGLRARVAAAVAAAESRLAES